MVKTGGPKWKIDQVWHLSLLPTCIHMQNELKASNAKLCKDTVISQANSWRPLKSCGKNEMQDLAQSTPIWGEWTH